MRIKPGTVQTPDNPGKGRRGRASLRCRSRSGMIRQMPGVPRVLYSFPHAIDRPGIAHTALQQVRGLAARGVEVTLFCTSVGSAVLPPSVEIHQTMVVGRRRVPHRAVGVQRAYAWHDRWVSRWLSRNSDRVDVVHTWPRGCLATLSACWRLGVPGLRESPNPHTASVQRESANAADDAGIALPPGHSHAPDEVVLAREWSEYGAAWRILVPSEYAYGQFVEEGTDPVRLLRHRYGCDLDRFPARNLPRPDSRPFTAVFLGRGDPTKGLHTALSAWQKAAIDGGVITVAGSIQPDYRRSLASRLDAPGVRSVGFVENPSALLREADVLLLPTWTEGSALVVFEAQASGCVPLVSVASGAFGQPGLDYLQHDVGDVATLTAQIIRLATSPEKLAALSARGTERRPELSWDAAATELAKCYAQAVEEFREAR